MSTARVFNPQRPGGRVPPALWAAVLAVGLAACRRDEVSYARVPKEAAAPTQSAAMGGAPGMAGDVPPPSAPTTALKWTLPAGWKQEMTGGMRYATLTPSVPGKVEATVVVLPGAAGGELANVNRWRGQIGLPPIDEAALGGARKTLKSKAGPVAIYDFTNDGQQRSRVVAGFALVEGSSWFLKLSGDAEPVAAARSDFIRLLESLRLD